MGLIYILLLILGSALISWIRRRSNIEHQPPTPEDLIIHKVAISPDGRYVAYSKRNWVDLLELESGRHVSTYSTSLDEADVLEFTPDGQFLAVSDFMHPDDPDFWGTKIEFIELGNASLPNIEIPGAQFIYGRTFSPDGNTLACDTGGPSISLINWRTGQALPSLTIAGEDSSSIYAKLLAFNPAFSSDGRFLAASIHRSPSFDEIFANGSHVTLATEDSQSDNGKSYVVHVWELKTGRHIRTLTGHRASISCITFCPEGRLLATGDAGGDVRIWDWQLGLLVYELKVGKSVSEIAYGPDGRYLAACGLEQTQVRDVETGNVIHTLVSDEPVYSITFNRNGQYLIAGGSSLYMWRLNGDGISPRIILGHEGWIKR